MMDILEQDKALLWHPFTQAATAPPPLAIQSARGAYLYTYDGRRIIDAISSWWVTLHGHVHPAIANAIAAQAHTLEQVIFAGCTHAPAVELAAQLTKLLPPSLSRVFYSDNGSTAVEVALKLALQYFWNAGTPSRQRLIAFEGGYHGDTLGAMSAGRGSGFFAPFMGQMMTVDVLPIPTVGYDDLEAVEQRVLQAFANLPLENTAALIIEPLIQGAGGMRLHRPEFLNALMALARQAGVLVIFDEVMTGFYRTGKLFALHHLDHAPDMVCLSKGLTGGFLPMAVTVCTETIYTAFLDKNFDKAFAHGHSFTANPLGCAAALASLALTQQQQTTQAVQCIESCYRREWHALATHPRARNVRHLGTIAALDVAADESGYTATIGSHLKAFFLEHNCLIRPLGKVIYLMPPLCIQEEDVQRCISVVKAALDSLA